MFSSPESGAHERPGGLNLLKYLHLVVSLKNCRGRPRLGKNNGATAGAALPCLETPVAPRCLRGKVQKPSLEFELLHHRAPPCLSDLIVGFDLLPRWAQRRPAPEPARHVGLPSAQPAISLPVSSLLRLTLFPGSARRPPLPGSFNRPGLP